MFYCVLSVRDFRTLYIGTDLMAARAAHGEGAYFAESDGEFERGEVERRAAIAAGYLSRGLQPPANLVAGKRGMSSLV